MVGHIYIYGQIGSYENEQGALVRGVELVDVIQQYQQNKEKPVLLVHVNSPGGLVDVGNNIYDYLNSLKKNHTVNTTSDGPIGSIATKIFLVGQEREIGDNHEFFIHNPWVDPGAGDSNYLDSASEFLKKSEHELRKFYVEKTAITEEGLKPLMDEQTSLTPDQALKLGFATKKKHVLQALALIKNNKNMPSKKTIGQQIDALLSKIKGEDTEPKAMLVDLEGGQQVFVFTEDETLEGKRVVIANEGQPTEEVAPDGDHTLSDGRVITVAEGLITAVQEGAPEEEVESKVLEILQAQNDRTEKLEEAVAKLTKSMEVLNESVKASEEKSVEELRNELDESIKALKDEIVVGKKPKFGKQFGKQNNETEYKLSGIQAKQKEIAERVKQQQK